MREQRPIVELVIDGRDVEAFEGETVLHAARREGISIPSLCYLEGLSEWGACRLCVVQVAERPQLQPACALAVEEDMEVTTDSDRIRGHRSGRLGRGCRLGRLGGGPVTTRGYERDNQAQPQQPHLGTMAVRSRSANTWIVPE